MAEATKVCELCQGSGRKQVDETTFEQCRCAWNASIRALLGVEIWGARTIQESDLYVPGENPEDPPIKDRTKEDLRIRGIWPDILSHLKWALWWKGLGFRTRIVTDERLRTVYVGSESYMSRSRKKRDDMETNNSIADLVGADHHLVVIRLGHLGYKNVAMPGILKETLMLRQTLLRPTWLVEEMDRPFCDGNFSWNVDVGDYVDRHFPLFDIDPNQYVTSDVPAPATSETSSAAPPPRARPQAPREPDEPFSGDEINLPEGPAPKFGASSKKKFKRGGGGPV